MKKEIYIEEAKNNLQWIKGLKKEGKFTFNIKMHYMSKLDGVAEIAARDRDLEPKAYKEMLEKYREIQGEMWSIPSDEEPITEI